MENNKNELDELVMMDKPSSNAEDGEEVLCHCNCEFTREGFTQQVKPKIIVLLGSTALKNILGDENSITAARGKWIQKRGIYYMPTWHPAALLRDENKKIEFWKDLRLVIEMNNSLKDND